jgi:eukaryotic-like serine/threonine-protein kinase
VGTNNTDVTFNDPSGVFTVYLERIVPEEGAGTFDKVDQEAQKLVGFYKKGGEYGTDIQEVSSSAKPANQQGVDARDIITSFREYVASEDAIRYRWHERLVVGEGGKAYWRLRVSMPDKGEAAKDGEQLFTDVAAYLEIRDL